ncbi:uncharacterized protein V1518DRAFT_423372 [Limtongia smithiae]|uniref:uncharacterized protein n=1 Tax=Limtongia smithiae TaxID=1125753 RepID=UPI0034CD0CC5
MASFALFKTLAVGTGVIGLGFALYQNAVPTEQEVVATFSPEVRQKYITEKKFKDASVHGNELIYATTSPSTSPTRTGSSPAPLSGDPTAHLYEMIKSNAASSRPAWMLTDHVEPRCVLHERDRVDWSTRAGERAREIAQQRMRDEAARLERAAK